MIVGYVYIYDHWRFFEIDENWITWILLFIGVDFFYYWFHRLAHEISLFWGTHIVHHQSEEYNLSVALRQSAFQGFVSMVFYFPLALVGFNPISFVTISAFQTLYQFWIHTKAIKKMPTWFEYIFNTPSHHRVHHGRNPKYIDKNHGGTLIIFDRLFGTFQEEEEEVIYGVTKPLASWNPVWANFDWYVDMWNDLKKPMSWKDRVRLLFNKPGWLPDHLGGYRAPHEIRKEENKVYDTEIPNGLNYYILFQYVVVLGITTVFLFNLDNFPLLQQLLIAGFIILSITNLGGIFEKKYWAAILEWGRWVLVMIAAIYAIVKLSADPIYISVLLVLVFISLFWFSRHRNVFESAS